MKQMLKLEPAGEMLIRDRYPLLLPAIFQSGTTNALFCPERTLQLSRQISFMAEPGSMIHSVNS